MEVAGSSSSSSSQKQNVRSRPPGIKRLVLTSSLLISFVIASPFLLNSVSIYRSHLPPLTSINSLSSPFLPQLSFHALSLSSSFSPNSSLHLSLSRHILTLSPSSNFTLSLSSLPPSPPSFHHLPDDTADQVFDELLSPFNNSYTVIVLESEAEEITAVVGRHKHAWIRAPRGKELDVVPLMASLFAHVFDHQVVHNTPLGSDGSLLLSFSLLNSHPSPSWIYLWDFNMIETTLLNPLTQTLFPLADVSVESQVLFHTPISAHPLLQNEHLPNFWHLDTSLATSKLLHFVLYIPSQKECPLFLQSPTNGFVSPSWGGVVVWNPKGCEKQKEGGGYGFIPEEELKKIFEVFVGQMRQLLGLGNGEEKKNVRFLKGVYGFTEWEMELLGREYSEYNVMEVRRTLGSLVGLVGSLPRMIVREEVGRRVREAMEGARLAVHKACDGGFLESALESRIARTRAEHAFFHPSVMSVSYYSFEHCFAIYSPFFLPVLVHLLLAIFKELVRFRRERLKFFSVGK